MSQEALRNLVVAGDPIAFSISDGGIPQPVHSFAPADAQIIFYDTGVALDKFLLRYCGNLYRRLSFESADWLAKL